MLTIFKFLLFYIFMYEIRLINRLFFFLIGVLLVTTAFAKLWLLLTDPFVDLKTNTSAVLLWLAICAEALVLTAIFRQNMRRKWILTFVVHCFFAFFSAWGIHKGSSNCGCFGSLELPPAFSLWLSLFVLALLLLNRSSCFELYKISKTKSDVDPFWSSAWIGSAVGVVGSILVISISLWFSRYSESLVRPLVGKIVEAKTDETMLVPVSLISKSSSPIRIVGFESSCSCLLLKNVKSNALVIQPKSALDLKLHMNVPQQPNWRYRVIFYLDSRDQTRLPVEFSNQML